MYLKLCYLISNTCDTSFRNDLIKENTGGKPYETQPSCILVHHCESNFFPMHISNTNLNLFLRYYVVNPLLSC